MIKHSWIADVLSDIEQYARQNNLTDLATSLENVLAGFVETPVNRLRLVSEQENLTVSQDEAILLE